MLFKREVLDRIGAGRITLAFRRWRRPTVRPGGTLRTTAGILAIDAVTPVQPQDITEAEARCAGYRSRAAVIAALTDRGPDGIVYRISFRLIGPDPRLTLHQQCPDEAEATAIAGQLAALDRASRSGPWTAAVLAQIAAAEGLPAGEIALLLDMDKALLKRRVRRLKDLGLTESLPVGYQLSARGRALIRAPDPRD